MVMFTTANGLLILDMDKEQWNILMEMNIQAIGKITNLMDKESSQLLLEWFMKVQSLILGKFKDAKLIEGSITHVNTDKYTGFFIND